jgi:large subunit ribosomal protein L1
MGKVSFDTEMLAENYGALLTELLRVKPSTANGRYVKSVVFSSTMGPGVKVDPNITRNFTA